MIDCHLETEDLKYSHCKIVIPEDADSEEHDVHQLLDTLNLNQINVKEYLNRPKGKTQQLQSLLKKRSHAWIQSQKNPEESLLRPLSLMERRRIDKIQKPKNCMALNGSTNEVNCRLQNL